MKGLTLLTDFLKLNRKMYSLYILLFMQAQLLPNDSFCIPVHQPERFGSEVMYFIEAWDQTLCK